MSPDNAQARLMPRFLARLRSFGKWIVFPFHWFHCRWQLIRPAWFSVLVVVLLVAAFLDAQTRDVLIATAEDGLRTVMMFLGLLVFSLTAWYCARANLYVDYKFLAARGNGAPRWQWCPPLEPEEAEVWRRRVPRFLGIALPICVGLVYLAYAWPIRTLDPNAGLGLASLLLAVVLYCGFVRRRHFIQGPLKAKLPFATFLVLLGLLLAIFALLLALVVLPLVYPATAALPARLGSPFLFLLAAAFWLAVGSFVLVYPTYRFRLTPSLVLVAVLVAGAFNWSPWRLDDHLVRSLPPDSGLAKEFAGWVAGRPDIRGQFDLWLGARATALAGATADRPYPVFVLAAEGGGIRAAYWTAAVLAELEDRMPGFACHVFAISGVSGGSLGAATYAGLIGERASRGELDCGRGWFRRPSRSPYPLASDVQSPAADSLLLSRATRGLGQDFLAPALAGLLYPDLWQRFLPVSVFPDRATYLETAWEGAWVPDRRPDPGKTCPDPERVRGGNGPEPAGNCMRAPFHSLWRPETATLVPSLFLNATEVETGRRLIVSNLRLPEECDGEKRRSFGAATDAFASACPLRKNDKPGPAPIVEPIRLSTAAGLSARFTYVSPPARLHNGTRVVDGGYYENGGVLTAHDVLRELQGASSYGDLKGKLRVVVIELVNSTFDDETAAEPGRDGWLASTFHETWAPIAALLRTRSARGQHAIVELRAALPGTLLGDVAAGHLHRFGLRRPGCRLTAYRDRRDDHGAGVRTFPLGWMLAPSTAKEIALQAKDAVEASLTPGSGWLARYARGTDEPGQELDSRASLAEGVGQIAEAEFPTRVLDREKDPCDKEEQQHLALNNNRQ